MNPAGQSHSAELALQEPRSYSILGIGKLPTSVGTIFASVLALVAEVTFLTHWKGVFSGKKLLFSRGKLLEYF